MSNAVLNRFNQNTRTYSPSNESAPGTQYGPAGGYYGGPSYEPEPYGPPSTQPPAPSNYMTLDDVVVRTGAMLGVLLVAASIAWGLGAELAWGWAIGGALVGFALVMYMSFTAKANAPLALGYAAAEGVFLGAVSRAFNEAYPGIVVQAVFGTLMVAVGMLVVYRVGAIRVTPRFQRVVIGATIGVVGLMVVNLIASFFGDGDGLGLRSGGALAIGFSLLCIVLAAFNLVLDFDMVEQGIRRGADERFAWFASVGLVVTLVWLYLEILRLLSYFSDN